MRTRSLQGDELLTEVRALYSPRTLTVKFAFSSLQVLAKCPCVTLEDALLTEKGFLIFTTNDKYFTLTHGTTFQYGFSCGCMAFRFLKYKTFVLWRNLTGRLILALRSGWLTSRLSFLSLRI